MDRLQRLTNLWGWLPHFRAIAETEHLPTAARRVHVSPSALSRAIHLLEEELEHPLFDRVGRTLRLNAHGRDLLGSVRDAMRLLDDSIAAIEGARAPTRLRVAASSAWARSFVIPRLAQLRARHPLLVPVLTFGPPAGELAASVLRGDLDLAVVHAVEAAPGLEIERWAEEEVALLLPAGHDPRAQPTLVELAATPFAVPGEPGLDVWPPELARSIALRAPLDAVLEACATGELAALVPRGALPGRTPHVPRSSTPAPELASKLGKVPVFAVRRAPASERSGALAAQLEQLRPIRSDEP